MAATCVRAPDGRSPSASGASLATQLIEQAKRRDRPGDITHLAFAILFIFTLGLGPTAPAISSGILAGYAVLRIWATWRATLYPFREPVIWCLLAVGLWVGLSILWSENRALGLSDWFIVRLHVPLVLALWPIIDRYRLLVWALMATVVVSAAVQLLQRFGVEPFTEIGFKQNPPGRYSAFWHPSYVALMAMVAGTLAFAALLPGAGSRGEAAGASSHRVRERGLAAIVIAACAISLALTGSRGPWAATVLAWGAAIGQIGWRHVRARRRRRASSWRRGLWSAAIVIVVVIASVATAMLAGSHIRDRMTEFTDELREVIAERDYTSMSGQRIYQVAVAWHIFREHPMTGAGMGSYQIAGRRILDQTEAMSADESPPPRPVLGHPHSAPLHVLAVSGLPGIVLLSGFVVSLSIAVVRAARRARFDYPALFPAALVGLFAAFAVDSHHMATPGTAVLVFVAAVAIYVQRTAAHADSRE